MYRMYLFIYRGQLKLFDDVVFLFILLDIWKNLIDGFFLFFWNDFNKIRLIN